MHRDPTRTGSNATVIRRDPIRKGTQSTNPAKGEPPSRDLTLHEPAHIEQDGRVTHVIIPVEEYERFADAAMVANAIAKLEDENAEWVDADVFAKQLAGEQIAAARKAAGLTQKQLAERLKLPQSQISRIERHPDHITVRTLKRVARALRVDVSALI